MFIKHYVLNSSPYVHSTGIGNFTLNVKAATLIFISGRGSAISSAK